MKIPKLIDIIEGKTYSFYKKEGDKKAIQIDAEDENDADEKIKQITGQDPKKVTKWSEDDDNMDENAFNLSSMLNIVSEYELEDEDEGEVEEISEDNTTTSLDGGLGMQQTPNAFRRKVKKPSDTTYCEPVNEAGLHNIKFTKLKQFGKVTTYQATNGNITIPFEVTRERDRKGTLLTLDSTKTGFYQSYKMDDIKSKIIDAFTHKMEAVNEVAYKEWVSDTTMSPKQKINKAILEVAKNLYEVERLIGRSAKLKTEINADQSIYWKNTVNKFTKINERLLKISSKIRNIAQ